MQANSNLKQNCDGIAQIKPSQEEEWMMCELQAEYYNLDMMRNIYFVYRVIDRAIQASE